MTRRGQFQGYIVLRKHTHCTANEFVVDEDFSFIRPNWDVLQVNKGAVTDGASIPRFFWRAIGCPIRGPWLAPAVLHDQLYRSQGCGYFTRKECDMIFREGLRALYIARWKVKAMYWGVRIGGWLPWRRRVELPPTVSIRLSVRGA